MKKIKNNINAFDIGILGKMDATEIATQIQKKNISVKEVIECVIERAQKVNPSINAIVNERYDLALEESSLKTNGCFAGVPTYIKDLNDVKGLPTLHGSNSIAHKPVSKNEKITQQILSTGCVILGKSTTSEFGLLPATETLRHGATKNPLNLKHSTGGSSGGAAALVASGIVPFAHGSDGGGSIRIPSSCCGLVGLKPSKGRDIESPASMLPIDIVCQGVLTRTVRDTANYFAQVEKYYSPSHIPSIGQVSNPIKDRLKIAMFSVNPSGIESHPDVVNAVVSAGEYCQSLGHFVELVPCPFTQEIKIDFLAYWSFITYLVRKFGKLTFGLGFKKHELETFTTQMAKVYPKMIFNTPGIIKRLKQFSIYYASFFDKYDVVLNPVLSHSPPEIGYFSAENNFFSTIEKLSRYVNFTPFQNITGAPSISLPMGKCSKGLPIGIQFSTALGEDRKLLELAFEIEQSGGFVNWFGDK
ncbi:MAG: amidase [Saprospiraceae bacterium]|nr:amidase [Saprospiraceae bacterium]